MSNTAGFNLAKLRGSFETVEAVLSKATEVVETDTVVVFGCARPNGEFLDSQASLSAKLSNCAGRFKSYWRNAEVDSENKQTAEELLADLRICALHWKRLESWLWIWFGIPED